MSFLRPVRLFLPPLSPFISPLHRSIYLFLISLPTYLPSLPCPCLSSSPFTSFFTPLQPILNSPYSIFYLTPYRFTPLLITSTSPIEFPPAPSPHSLLLSYHSPLPPILTSPWPIFYLTPPLSHFNHPEHFPPLFLLKTYSFLSSPPSLFLWNR